MKRWLHWREEKKKTQQTTASKQTPGLFVSESSRDIFVLESTFHLSAFPKTRKFIDFAADAKTYIYLAMSFISNICLLLACLLCLCLNSFLWSAFRLLFNCQVLLLDNRKHLICKWNYTQSPHHSWKNNVLIDRNKNPQDIFVNQVLC